MKKRIFVLIVLLMVPFTGSAYADSVNDIFEIYGKETQQEAKFTREDYNLAVKNYQTALAKALADKESEKAYDIGQQFLSAETAKLEKEVFKLMQRNNYIIDKINKDIITLTEDELVALDSEYKLNEARANSLLQEIDKYVMPEKVVTDTYNVDGALDKVKTMEKDLNNAVNLPDIGEVKSVRHPVDNAMFITSPFGSRINPNTKKTIQFHSGTDFRAAHATPVLAQFNGKVISAKYITSSGNTLKIDHGNGVVSLYGHLTSFNVKPGDMVKQYDVVALSGNTGFQTTGPHLHFGLYINGVAVDPAKLNYR